MAFETETENWNQLLRALTPEQLDSPRRQFNDPQAALPVCEVCVQAGWQARNE